MVNLILELTKQAEEITPGEYWGIILFFFGCFILSFVGYSYYRTKYLKMKKMLKGGENGNN